MKLKARFALICCLLALVLMGLGIWIVVCPVPIQSPREMHVLAPDFLLSLPDEGDSPIAWTGRTLAMFNARFSGEECRALKTIRCPQSGHLMHVLSADGITDMELIYRAGYWGLPLLDKCYHSGFGGWVRRR
jgi:hypothetical protein